MARLPKMPPSGWLTWVLIGILVTTVFIMMPQRSLVPSASLTYSDFKELVGQGQVERVVFEGEKISGELRKKI